MAKNTPCRLVEAVSVSGAGTATEVIVDPIVHFGAWQPSTSTPCRASRT